VCFGIGAANSGFGTLRDTSRWCGLGFFLLVVVLGLCYTVRPGLLGDPLSWAIARGYRTPVGALYRRYPRLPGLLLLWMGFCTSGLFWLLGNAPPLYWESAAVEAIVLLGALGLTFGPPLLVIKVFTRRMGRRGSQHVDPSAGV
jgi:hypothetical protein